MSKRILFTLAKAPTEGYKDGLVFAKELVERGFDVFFVDWLDFTGSSFSKALNFNSNKTQDFPELNSFELIFIYKQEGFLDNLERFFEMVTFFESSQAILINNPNTIKKNISKEYFFDLQDKGIDVIPTFYVNNEVRERLAKGEKMVIKPKISERGKGQELISSLEELDRLFPETSDYLAQDFCEEIKEGEKSLVFLGKEFSHACIKIPSKEKGEYRCNVSNGGWYENYIPSQLELDFAQKVLCSWEEDGYPTHFSRIDIITRKGVPVLMEAELLNPSIYASICNIQKEFSKKLADYFSAQLILSEGGEKWQKSSLVSMKN